MAGIWLFIEICCQDRCIETSIWKVIFWHYKLLEIVISLYAWYNVHNIFNNPSLSNVHIIWCNLWLYNVHIFQISMVKRHLVDDMDEIPTSTPRRNNSPAPSMSSTPIKRTPEKINSSVVYAKKGSPTGSEIITPAKHRPSKRPRTPRWVKLYCIMECKTGSVKFVFKEHSNLGTPSN